MAYNICSDALSNIGVQCGENPQAGFTGRAIVGLKKNMNCTKDSNGDILTVTDTSMVLVDNVWPNTMDGTQASLVTDNGRSQWHRDLSVRVPRVGSGITTRETVKALAANPSWGIFEREDGTYLACGFNGKMIATAQTQAENASAGDWVNTLGTDENTPETLFVDTPASGSDSAVTAKEKFNTMWQTIVAAA